jgi:Tfp pilus assembly protein FimT
MDGVERLTQMNEVERMREVMDVISDNMRKQNDKDRMEMLAMLSSTTAMETNLMSVQFAHSADKQATGTKTKKQGKALIKGVERAENGKGKSKGDTKPVTLSAQPPAQQSQQQSQQQQAPASTLATRTHQAMNKKNRLAGKVTTGTIKPFSTI